jgi:hypothetical protein
MSPFCALTVAVDLDDGGVDHRVFHVRIVGYSLENPLENAGLRPIAVALEHGVPLAEMRRKIAPGAAGARDPKHRLQKQPVVPERWLRLFGQIFRLSKWNVCRV